MKILIATDKFKGSLTAQEASKAIHQGLNVAAEDIEVKELPLADGGEGTCEILTAYAKGEFIKTKTRDPIGRTIQATYGLSPDKKTAFIEMASASGLHLLKPQERNPLNTSSYGTGLMIAHAVEGGPETIILGVGGTATNDVGTGMATALGYRFYAGRTELSRPVGDDLSRIERIDDSGALPGIKKTRFIVLCDVDNPLYGPTGAARVFGPQKGADAEAVVQLDAGLKQFAGIVRSAGGPDLQFPGAGAAGGMGAGTKLFLNATLESGFEFISRYAHLKDHIIDSDLVFTGEGSLDQQTAFGKVVKGVAALAFRSGKPCIAMVGRCMLTTRQWKALHLQDVHALASQPSEEEMAMKNAYSLLVERAARALEMWKKK